MCRPVRYPGRRAGCHDGVGNGVALHRPQGSFRYIDDWRDHAFWPRLPVGGVKEKVLAAHRAGIRRIILPDRNESDIDEIPEDVRKELTIIPAKRISDVLSAALETEAAPPAVPVPHVFEPSTQNLDNVQMMDSNEPD